MLPEVYTPLVGLHIRKGGLFFIFDLKYYFMSSDLHKAMYVLKKLKQYRVQLNIKYSL